MGITREAYLHLLNKKTADNKIKPALEKDIVKQILQYLRLNGYAAGKIKSHGVYDEKRKIYRIDKDLFIGLPDIICFTKERMVFIEVKSKKGIQSEDQKAFQELCFHSNACYILARDVNDVIPYL